MKDRRASELAKQRWDRKKAREERDAHARLVSKWIVAPNSRKADFHVPKENVKTTRKIAS